MVNKKINKKGFSIAEALVSMLILSIFFIATSKVMTTKQKPDISESPHGFYECYVVNNKLKQKYSSESNVSAEQSVDSCTFSPPQGLAYVTIYAVKNSTTIKMAIEPQFNYPIKDITSVSKLASFGDDYLKDIDDSEQNSDLNINDFRKFLEMSYPKSGLLAIIKNGTYLSTNPALFIGW